MTLDDLQELAKLSGRVCPLPHKWHQLYELLPNKRTTGSGHQPPVPLILAAWGFTSDDEKSERLSVHLRHAANEGALDRVGQFLVALREDDWHHRGD